MKVNVPVSVALLNADGSIRDEDEMLADVQEIVDEIKAQYSYAVIVDGKPIGLSEEMPALTHERAIALFKTLMDAATRVDTTFSSSSRYATFGVFHRVDGAWKPVPAFQHRAEKRRKERGRWVR